MRPRLQTSTQSSNSMYLYNQIEAIRLASGQLNKICEYDYQDNCQDHPSGAYRDLATAALYLTAARH